MEQYDLWKLDKKLQKEVDEDRYHHTLGVMFTVSRDCFTTVQNAFRIRKKSPCVRKIRLKSLSLSGTIRF